MTALPLRVPGIAIQDGLLDPALLEPKRRPAASPDDELERTEDWGLIAASLAAMEGCPGLLVVHADGFTECVEGSGCPPDLMLHLGVVSCAELPGCSC